MTDSYGSLDEFNSRNVLLTFIYNLSLIHIHAYTHIFLLGSQELLEGNKVYLLDYHKNTIKQQSLHTYKLIYAYLKDCESPYT